MPIAKYIYKVEIFRLSPFFNCGNLGGLPRTQNEALRTCSIFMKYNLNIKITRFFRLMMRNNMRGLIRLCLPIRAQSVLCPGPAR